MSPRRAKQVNPSGTSQIWQMFQNPQFAQTFGQIVSNCSRKLNDLGLGSAMFRADVGENFANLAALQNLQNTEPDLQIQAQF